MAKTPEQKARREIDADLAAAGWIVQDRDDLDLTAGCSVVVRDFTMKPGFGFADYLIYVETNSINPAARLSSPRSSGSIRCSRARPNSIRKRGRLQPSTPPSRGRARRPKWFTMPASLPNEASGRYAGLLWQKAPASVGDAAIRAAGAPGNGRRTAARYRGAAAADTEADGTKWRRY